MSIYPITWQTAQLVSINSLLKSYGSPLRTVATAQTYFHVFFHEQTHLEGREQRYPPMDIALTALLVASKAEETFKKIRAILSAAFIELNPSFAGSDVDVNVRIMTPLIYVCRLSRITGKGLFSMKRSSW